MQDTYEQYWKFLESDNDKAYKDALRLYFNKDPKQVCPKCGKSGIEKNIEKDGNIIMKCKDTKCKWIMKIEVGEYINLYDDMYKINQEKKKLLYKLIKAEQTDFKEYKEKFIEEKNKNDEIKNLFDSQNIELNKLEKDKVEILIELLTLYYKRKEIFKEINERIKDKKILLQIYKNEGNELSSKRLKEISNDINISTENINKYFEWLNLCKHYIELQNDYNNIIKREKTLYKKIEDINKNFPTKIPKIISDEKKTIKISKKALIPTEYDLKGGNDDNHNDEEDNDEDNHDDKDNHDDEDNNNVNNTNSSTISNETNDNNLENNFTNDNNDDNDLGNNNDNNDDNNDNDLGNNNDNNDLGNKNDNNNDNNQKGGNEEMIKIIKIPQEHLIPSDNDRLMRLRTDRNKEIPGVEMITNINTATSGIKEVKMKKYM